MVYTALLAKFRNINLSDLTVEAWKDADDRAFEAQVDLLEGQRELRMGGNVVPDDDPLFGSEDSDSDDGIGAVIEYGSFTDEEDTGGSGSELEVAGLVLRDVSG